MQVTRETIDEALALLIVLVREDDALAAEFEASIDEFFRGPVPGGSTAETLLAARRHSEWFLLERHSPTLRTTPGERLGGAFDARVRELDRERDDDREEELSLALDSVRRSHTGVFEVEEVREGEGAWLRDVAGFGSFAMSAPELSKRLATGDLVVGRLFPLEGGVYAPSPAAGVFRGPELLVALERDLSRAREASAVKVLRLSQLALEVMFFAPASAHGGSAQPEADASPDVSTDGDPVGDARALLVQGGTAPEDVQRILAELAAHPFDPDQLVLGAGDVLGALLDELAFETDVDLAAAREVLLRAWLALSRSKATTGPEADGPRSEVRPDVNIPRPAPSTGDPEEDERRRAVDAFAAGLEGGGDPGQLLSALRGDLGLDDDEDDDPDALAPAPDFPGVVGAMVEEFVWETGASEGAESAKALAPLAHLATFAADIGVFEELSGSDLLRFTTFWVHERSALRDAGEARALVEALGRFCAWSREAQEHDLSSGFADALDGLHESLPRAVEANSAVPAADASAGSDDAGQLFEFVDGTHLVDTDGERHTVEIVPELRSHLTPGDRLRGRITLEGRAVVYRCYPPEAAGLLA